jgi:hypothetical protein
MKRYQVTELARGIKSWHLLYLSHFWTNIVLKNWLRELLAGFILHLPAKQYLKVLQRPQRKSHQAVSLLSGSGSPL